jgi:hypothetical protein
MHRQQENFTTQERALAYLDGIEKAGAA